MQRIAIIDIGTFTCRLAYADLVGGRIVHFKKRSRVCDLGAGVDATGLLDTEAIGRVLVCVDDYSARITKKGADIIVCTLTSAARDARNASELTSALEARGISAQVISGEQEGKYTFLGVSHALPDRPLLVADSGGGSTELILGSYSSHEHKEHIAWVKSVNLGCRRVTDRLLHNHYPPSPEELDKAYRECVEEFRQAHKESATYMKELSASVLNTSENDSAASLTLAVCGGTATTLSAANMQLHEYDSAIVHHSQLTREELGELMHRLAACTLEQIEAIPGIQAKRAPVILGGSVVLAALMDVFDFDTMTISETDLLHGLAISESRRV